MSGYVLPKNFLAGGGEPEPSTPSEFFYDSLDDRVNTATSVITLATLIQNATPHAAGAYVEIDPSLSGDCEGIRISQPATSASAAASLSIIEIATGANAAEVVWARVTIGNIGSQREIFIPGFLASGTRVTARVRGIQAGTSRSPFYFKFVKARAVPFGAPSSYGCDTATSKGVVLATPAGTNQKGAWTQIVAATAADHTCLLIGIQLNGNTNVTAGDLLIDIGIGAAAAETVIVSNHYISASGSEAITMWHIPLYGIEIPVGSRLSARFQTTHIGTILDISLVCA